MDLDQIGWILWLTLALILIVAEIFTLGFVLLWFGVGALVAAIASMLGFGVVVQFLLFAVVSTGLTIASRTIVSSRLLHRGSEEVKTNIDALPGKVGTVTAASAGALNEAAVKVYGSTWTAFPDDDDTPLLEGDKVEVLEVRGSSIVVRKVTRELPGWKEE